MPRLPIEDVLPTLRRTLTEGRNALLTAAPGAGKTTRVPLALLDAPWLDGKRLLMLEPRRLAARAAAHRMATTLGDSVGETVGYRMRLDTKVGPKTRIEVVTEGVLSRLLQSDPELSATAGSFLWRHATSTNRSPAISMWRSYNQSGARSRRIKAVFWFFCQARQRFVASNESFSI
jgi:hypothetical protein